MSIYIEQSDLTDSIINDFSPDILLAKLELSDYAVEDLAEIKGVLSDNIETDPVHWKLKRYAIYWVYSEICFDFIGKNNVDIIEQEKYYKKYEMYKNSLNEIKLEITPEMITGNVGSIRDRATVSTGTLFRS